MFYTDYAEVRRRASIADVLARYNVQLKKQNVDALRGKCPLPTHTSQKDNFSFCVNTAKNCWSCKSDSCKAASGREGGNTADLVMLMESLPTAHDAFLKLAEWYGVPVKEVKGKRKDPAPKPTPAPQPAAPEIDPVAVSPDPPVEVYPGVTITYSPNQNFPLATRYPDFKGLKGIAYCDYLKGRGISEETAATFGCGFFPGKGIMAGRVVIPIHNTEGELIAYAGRALDDSRDKYHFPAGFKKSYELFNLNRIPDDTDSLVVVEGFFDVMWLHQAGIKNTVALMGSTVSEEQFAILAKFARVTLFLDGDDAGRKCADAVAPRLMHYTFVRVISIEGKQPDGVPTDELRAMLLR